MEQIRRKQRHWYFPEIKKGKGNPMRQWLAWGGIHRPRICERGKAGNTGSGAGDIDPVGWHKWFEMVTCMGLEIIFSM